MRKAEAKDIVFYERNYLTIEGKMLINRPQFMKEYLTDPTSNVSDVKENPLTKQKYSREGLTEAYRNLYNVALPKGRVPIEYGSNSDTDIFLQIDTDRRNVQKSDRDETWEVYKSRRAERNKDVTDRQPMNADAYNTDDPNVDRYKEDFPYQRGRL
jgi:hypothetical protein